MLRILLAIALIVAACAGPAATTEPTPAPTIAPTVAPATAEPTQEPTEPPTDEPTAAPTDEPTASAGDTVDLSPEGYLVGPEGLSLYTFDPDEPGVSNCEGDCLVNWPALAVDSEDALTVADGLDAAQFTTITRSDGSLQVAFSDMPLYYFIGDTAPGDINGDGLNDVWHLARPDGATTGAAVAISPEGHLIGLQGLTLYTFDNDAPGVSNCAGDCLVNWPPVLVAAADDIRLGEGLDPADFGTITRDDGTVQVTYQGSPLYFFVGDLLPGDVNGDGLNDVWHIISTEDGASALDPIDY